MFVPNIYFIIGLLVPRRLFQGWPIKGFPHLAFIFKNIAFFPFKVQEGERLNILLVFFLLSFLPSFYPFSLHPSISPSLLSFLPFSIGLQLQLHNYRIFLACISLVQTTCHFNSNQLINLTITYNYSPHKSKRTKIMNFPLHLLCNSKY